MSSAFLIDVLNDKTEFVRCIKWLSGQTNEVPEYGIKRLDFALFFLGYLQEQTAVVLGQKRRRPECENHFRKDCNNDRKETPPGNVRTSTPNKPLCAGGPVRRIFSPEQERASGSGSGMAASPARPPQRTLSYHEKMNSPQEFVPSMNTSPKMLFSPQMGGYFVPFTNACPPDRTPPLVTPPPNFYSGHGLQYGRAAHGGQSFGYVMNGVSPLNVDAYAVPSGAARNHSPQNQYNNYYQTPKLNWSDPNTVSRSNSSCSSEFSVLSPESPMYSSNFPEIGDRTDKAGQDRRPSRTFQSPSFGDFVPPNPVSNRKQSQNKKRIKPTKLTPSPAKAQRTGGADAVEKKTNFGYDNFTKVPEISAHSAETSQTSKVCGGNSGGGGKQKAGDEFVEPDPSRVANSSLLIQLAEIYCTLLDSNLIPNITAEMYFVLCLLTAKVLKSKVAKSRSRANHHPKAVNETERPDSSDLVESEPTNRSESSSSGSCESVAAENKSRPAGADRDGRSEKNYRAAELDAALATIDECVYFAGVVLERQVGFILLLDKTTLKLMADNTRMNLFVPKLVSEIKELHSLKDKVPRISLERSTAADCSGMVHPVPFQMETDNRDTFATTEGFSAFRKQRDTFYDILQTWNQMHDKRGWSFEKIAQRVEKLLAMSSDPINMRHLARHFCDLLLKAVTSEESAPEEQLTYLPEMDKSKLSLLTARLTQPSSEKQNSPRPDSHFPGLQQFYHDFLVVPAPNYLFNMHLINCFTRQIIALNGTTYEIDESDESGQAVQEETRQMFLLSLNSSCVIAKFLGLIVFAPYRSRAELPQTILQEEIDLRKKMEIPLDLQGFMDSAQQQGRLVHAVPWIVEFLGMMDATAPHLPAYQGVLRALFSLYLSTAPRLAASLAPSDTRMGETAVALQTLNVAVDRKAETFMDDDSCEYEQRLPFSRLAATFLRLCLGWLFDTSNFPLALFSKMGSAAGGQQLPTERARSRRSGGWQERTMDSSDLVDERVLHKCCPYLRSARLRFAKAASDGAAPGPIRHITPIPSGTSMSPAGASDVVPEVAVELQLEEHFFMGQSESVRRTVEFVAERVASACIKHVCSVVIVGLKKRVLEVRVSQRTRVDLQPYITEYNRSVMDEIEKAKRERLGVALKALLGPDTIDQSLHNVCHLIAGRKCQERVVNWLQGHINIAELLMKIQLPEDEQSEENDLGLEAGESDLVDESTTVAKMMILLQDATNDALESSGQQGLRTSAELVVLLERLDKALGQSFKSAAIVRQLLSLGIDYLLLTVAYRPDEVTGNVMRSLCSVLTKWECCEAVHRLWSHRNVLLLCQGDANASSRVWKKFSDLVVYLTKAGVLSMESLEEQAVTLFRCTWPEDVLRWISMSLRSTLEGLRGHCDNSPEFFVMLELLSEMAAEMTDDVE